MPVAAVTFDFHNTIANCDRWFDLEIRELVAEVLKSRAAAGGKIVPEAHLQQARDAYRVLRTAVMADGHEVDAYECTERVLNELGEPMPAATLHRIVDAVMMSALPDSTPVDGVLDAIRAISNQRVPLAVISSAVHHNFVEASLVKFGIRQRFAHVVTSASCGYYKSKPEIYTYTLDQLGVGAEDAIHVGDSLRYDVKTAGEVGMGTVWFKRREEQVEGAIPDMTVETLVGLYARLQEHPRW